VLLLASDGTGAGDKAVPTFGDSIVAGQPGGTVVGWVLFDGAVEYTSVAAFSADACLHCVPPNSPFAFREPEGSSSEAGSSGKVYGWRVVASHRLDQPQPLPAMKRVFRSVYQKCH